MYELRTVNNHHFHGITESETVNFGPRRVVGSHGAKNLIVQERELGYRFYLHQHPYVQQLVQRLLRGGTAGLQAADTDPADDGAALPGSVEIAVDDGTVLSIPAGATIALLGPVRATSGRVPIDLASDMAFRTAGVASVTLSQVMKATMVDGISETHPAGEGFTLRENSRAIVFGSTRINLSAATEITLHDGEPATMPSGTQVSLAGGTEFSIPNGTQVTFLKSKSLPELYADFFEAHYNPSSLVQRPYPVKDLDFTTRGAYSVYNWELFYHVPFMIAIHLGKNQRFAEAQRWFHFLFDPTDDSDGPTPERFWKVRPFQYTDVKKIEEILVNLATGADKGLQEETVDSIEAWMDAPFRPHVIARFRQPAYMFKTVMAYLDNLIAWGDSLFRQDTGEAVDEALQLYVLAANILGPRPQPVPKKGNVRPQTYANLRCDLREFGSVMRGLEAALPYDLMPFPSGAGGDGDRLAILRSLGQTLYFCVPRNDKLLDYWDTVADRLFKIRNSLNIQGVFRQLTLFEPPIDPAMLARATAAGLDVGAIVNGLNQPLPLVRFQFLVQKSIEIIQEVKSLGNNLLSAIEKEDGEALAILRARHERVIMKMVEHVKYDQLQETIKSREGLLKSLALAIQRYTYYELQLGKQKEEIENSIPKLGDLDKESLDQMEFVMVEEEMNPNYEIDKKVDIARDSAAEVAQAFYGGKLLSSHEVREAWLLEGAQLATDTANILNVASSISHYVPEFTVNVQPMGGGASIDYGGREVGSAIGATAAAAKAIADRMNFEARRANRIDSYARRELDWAFQSNLAAGEISQIFKQLRAAQIREAIAERELQNHRQQMRHAAEIEQFLNEEGNERAGKTSNKALYTWMKREVKGLYAQSFQFAFDIARKAERALQHELGNPDLSYLQFGYLAGKEGLLAGEKLLLDVKRMELAYHELNQREYELTKHISLREVDPLALIQLRQTGRCTVRLPEVLFDLDGPGHYFRRIKTVAVTIPCVTGPYASINCTLTLVKSSIRTTPVVEEGYDRADAEDGRFSDHFGSLQSIVTSSAQNDSGLFETNLRDERYLPFENSGVISEWRLELPADPSAGDPAQFDYDTISDVILHLRYTAREGGSLLRTPAVEHLKARVDKAQAAGSVRLFSIRHEFPNEWAQFKSIQRDATTPVAGLTLNLREEHYPFWSRGGVKVVKRAVLIAKPTDSTPPSIGVSYGAGVQDSLVSADESSGNLRMGDLTNVPLLTPTGELSLHFDDNSMKDLWMLLTWGKAD